MKCWCTIQRKKGSICTCAHTYVVMAKIRKRYSDLELSFQQQKNVETDKVIIIMCSAIVEANLLQLRSRMAIGE